MKRCHISEEQFIEGYKHVLSGEMSVLEFAKSLNLTERAVYSRKKKLAEEGKLPDVSLRSDMQVTGVSELYGPDGETKLKWIKSGLDKEEKERLYREAVEALSSKIKREKPVAKPRKKLSKDLLNTYIITDYHMGMKAWAAEAGDPWDIEIAENLITDWFKYAISIAPDTDTAILCNLGDWAHWDGLDAVTPMNKHVLDADTRFEKMIRVSLRSIKRIVSMLLQKHRHVHLIMAEGNHDMASSAWLRETFNLLYEKEPRITVDTSPDPYYCYEHGNTSLFFHHGHLKKVTNIDDVFTAKFRDVFGRTKYSYAHMGHYHFDRKNETNLMIIEQHRTLAASDAYASRGGWISGRDAKVISYHQEYGEDSRITISPDRLAA